MNTKTNKVLTGLFILFIGLTMIPTFAGSVYAADYGLDLVSTPELFEDNAHQPAIDIWLNQSVGGSGASQHLEKYGIDAINQGWTMRHVRLYTPTPNLELTQALPNSILEVYYFMPGGSGDVNDAGYLAWSDRDIDERYNYDANTFKLEDAGNTYTLGYDYLNDTTLPTASNYTFIDRGGDSLLGCTTYDANDGKSIFDYATELAEADGGKLYKVQNSTFLGFMKDPESMKDVIVYFEEPQVAASMLYIDANGGNVYSAVGSVLKRYRVFLQQKKFDRDMTSMQGGDMTTTKSRYVSIQNALGNLEQIPVGTKQYASQGIGTAFEKLKLGTGSIFNGFKKALLGFLGVISFGFLVLIALLWIFRKRIPFVKKYFK